MPGEHWNDVPGDIAGSDAENLPGGFGIDNPDNNTDATVDDLIDNDVTDPLGNTIAAFGEAGGTTAGTAYAEGTNSGSTINPNELVSGEEAHPGAGVGFTGGENDKRVDPEALRAHEEQSTGADLGGTPDETNTAQQRENMSIETESRGGEGHAGSVQPPQRKRAA